MFAATTVTVHAGDTMSALAQSYGYSLSAMETANPQVRDPNLIFAGETLNLPSGRSVTVTSHHSDRGDGDHDSDDYGTAGLPEHSASPSSVAPVYHAHHYRHHHSYSPAPAPAPNYSPGYSGSGLADVPGVPRAFAACVAFRESTNLQNPAARGNAYGIIPASGYNGYAMSLAQQKATFAHLYHLYGDRPWAPSDGCHG